MTPFALGGFYFFYFALVAVHVIFFPKVLNLLGYSFVELSVIMAASPLIRFLSPFLFVKYIKLSKGLFLFALALSIVSALALYVVIDHFWALLGVALVLGFGLGLVLPYVEIVALEHIPKENYGKVRLYGSIGFIVVSLVLVEYIDNPYNALHFLFALTVVMMGFGWLLLKSVDEEIHTPQEPQHASIKPFLRDKSLWISLFLMQLAFMPFYSFFFIHETAHGLSNQMTIYLWSFGVVCEIAMLYFQGRFIHRFEMIDLLIFSTFVTVGRWLLLYLFPENVIIIGFSQMLHAFSFALYHTVAIRYLYTLYTNKKLAQQFFLGVAYGLGGLLGTLIAGVWYEYSAQTIYLYASIMTLIGGWLLVVHKRASI